MFATLESFSIFFFTCLALIILGIVFEEKLIEIEKKIDRKISKKKASGKNAEIRKLKTKKSSAQPSRTDKRQHRPVAA